ncbi:MAG TPA: hypothetical protein VMZ53_05270 [Kofleriaceae bacterium]|nr:hypothetical protein [Kofleriaceae bacterium]
MTPFVKELLLAELTRRGYHEGKSPNGTIVLDVAELIELDIAEFLDLMVTRREKISRSIEALGKDKARAGFEDADHAVEAIKTVIKKLTD